MSSSPGQPTAGPVAEGFPWGGLAARVIHPVQVEVIEALLWIDLPLTATDLLHVFDAKRSGLLIEHHIRRLTRLDAVMPIDNEQARRGPMADRSYCLVRHPKT